VDKVQKKGATPLRKREVLSYKGCDCVVSGQFPCTNPATHRVYVKKAGRRMYDYTCEEHVACFLDAVRVTCVEKIDNPAVEPWKGNHGQ